MPFQKGNTLGKLAKHIITKEMIEKQSIKLKEGYKNNKYKVWNKGLTLKDDDRLKKMADSIKKSWYNNFEVRKKSMILAKKRQKDSGYYNQPEVIKRLREEIKFAWNSPQGGFKISKPQSRMAKLLGKKIYKDDLKENYHICIDGKNMFLDVAFPNEKVAFEFNGKYWHKNRILEDEERKFLLEKNGWQVYFYNEDNLEELNDANKEAQLFLQKEALNNYVEMMKCLDL